MHTKGMGNGAILHDTLPLVSAITIMAVYAYCFKVLHLYDWGEPFAKLIAFGILAGLVAYVAKQTRRPDTPSPRYYLENGLVAVVLVVVISNTAYAYLSTLLTPPLSDTTTTVEAAAAVLIQKHQNPYQSRTIAIIGENPDQWGFKYGPFMMVGYLPGAFFPPSGSKIVNLAYLIATAGLVVYLARSPGRMSWQNATGALFALALFLLPERLWYELLWRGVNDIFPILLLLIALLCIKKKWWFAAGLAAGLTFSTKFALALPFLVLLVRRPTPQTVYFGIAAGLLPLAIFFLWNPVALINNVFLFHLVKEFDSTSLYSITPPALHWLFPLIQVAALGYAFARNVNQTLEYRAVTKQLLLLLIIIEVTYKEVHNNHLVFFMPLLALALSWYRYRLLLPPTPAPATSSEYRATTG